MDKEPPVWADLEADDGDEGDSDRSLAEGLEAWRRAREKGWVETWGPFFAMALFFLSIGWALGGSC